MILIFDVPSQAKEISKFDFQKNIKTLESPDMAELNRF